MRVFRSYGLAAIFAAHLIAQAPSGLTVASATSKQVSLHWTGIAASYTVQRAPAGSAFATIGTAAGNSYTDSNIDPAATYQYQVLNAAAASSAVTVGPPPAGLSVASLAPVVGDEPSPNYGYDLSMTLDANGDPAFAFFFVDPNGDGDDSDTEVLFRSWNRAQYQWNPAVKVAAVGNSSTTFHESLALACDVSTDAFAVAVETVPSDSLAVYSSPDGITWTLKRTIANGNSVTESPSLAMANGNLYLAYVVENSGLKYLTGKLTDAATNWTVTSVPKVSGVGPAVTSSTVSLALDSSGAPGVAYWSQDSANGANEILFYWRPASSGAPVKVLDTGGNSTEVSVSLRYFNSNPRIVLYALRTADEQDSGDGVQFTQSNDGGATWTAPVPIPPNGDATTDFPMQLALDSQDRGAIAFGENGSSGDNTSTSNCGNPRVARSANLTNWTTCDIANGDGTFQSFGPYPGGLQIAFASNDKLYLLWWEVNDTGIGTGVLMYREPPAGSPSAPAISSVVNNASGAATIVPGSWVTIYGSNLAGVTSRWDNFITGTTLPNNIDGVQVKIGGIPSSLYYISPSQINVQAPAGIAGPVVVQVVNNGAASAPFTANASNVAPGLFSYLYPAENKEQYPSAVFNSSGIIVGDPAQVPGTSKVKPGDIIQLYATGLGPSPAGVTIGAPVVFSGAITVTVGTASAQVLGAALTYPGEFQINIVTPSLAPGDYPITISVGGHTSQTGVFLPVGQ